MTSHEHQEGGGHYLCPTCQQHIPHAQIDVVDVAAAVAADKLTEADVFKRTYIGHGTQSSVFVFQGHPGPFRTHVHVTHDEIGYVLEGTGQVTVGGITRPVKKGDVWVIPANTPHGGAFEDAPQVLFISSPIDDPDNQDRVWIDD
jgi:quercetin dioxygenase-like cupin family protein